MGRLESIGRMIQVTSLTFWVHHCLNFKPSYQPLITFVDIDDLLQTSFIYKKVKCLLFLWIFNDYFDVCAVVYDRLYMVLNIKLVLCDVKEKIIIVVVFILIGSLIWQIKQGQII